MYVCVGRIEHEKDIFDITEIVYDHVFFLIRCAMWENSTYCKKISDKMPVDGAPIASLSFCIIILSLSVK